VHVFFGPRNPLTGNGRIAVNYGCVGAYFGPRSPLTSFGGIMIKLEEDFLFCCESHIHAWNIAQV